MDKVETLEYNRRCAKFMGYYFGFRSTPIRGGRMSYRVLYGKDGIPTDFHRRDGVPRAYEATEDELIGDLEFHKDWNLIMGVKQYIVGMGFYWFQFPDCIQINENGTISSKHICKIQFNKLGEKEAVIQAINEFLIWYEETNK